MSDDELLTKIPPEILFTRGRPGRAGKLLRWCEARDYWPTLAEIEGERERRRALDRGEGSSDG